MMNFNQGLLKMKEAEDSKCKSTPVAMVAPELKQNSEADTEITKTCAVLGCEESKNLNSDSFFRFPEDPNLRQIWTDLTGRNNWTPTDFSYICVQHFSVDCFECDSENRVVLISKAVPSLKLPNHVLEGYVTNLFYMVSADPTFEVWHSLTEKYIKQVVHLVLSDNHCQNRFCHMLLGTKKWVVEKCPSGPFTHWVEYIDEDTFDHDDEDDYDEHEMESEEEQIKPNKQFREKHIANVNETDNFELLKLFAEVQRMQRQAISLRDKLKCNMRVYDRQNRFLGRLKKLIETKKSILNQKKKKKARILLSLQDKIKEDTNGLVLAMPTRQTEDLKNFALSIYKYSPQAYIYIRNTLRTLLPSTDVLESWLSSGFEPKNTMSSSSILKVVAEQTDSELLCRVSIR